MSFAKKRDEKVASATKPYGFSSPYGSTSVKNGAIKFQPNQTTAQKQTQSLTDAKIRGVVNTLPTKFDVNKAFNNPFYGSVLSLLNRPVQQQQQREGLDLTNDLNARNQLGGSFEALSRKYQNQRFDDLYGQNEDKARNAAFNAYQQATFTNPLALLAGLRQDRNAAIDALYTPAKIGAGYQSSITPLQQTNANHLSQQKTPFENYVDYTTKMAAALNPL